MATLRFPTFSLYSLYTFFFFALLNPHFTLVTTAKAQTEQEEQAAQIFKTWGFSFGNMTEYAFKVQTDNRGEKNPIEWKPYLALRLPHSLSSIWMISPELGFVFPQKAKDGSVTRWVSYLQGHFGYSLTFLKLGGGAGLFLTHLQGHGGQQTLRNGNDYSSFYNPSYHASSLISSLDFEIEVPFNSLFSTRLSIYCFNLFDTPSRQVNYSLSLTYYFHLASKE